MKSTAILLIKCMAFWLAFFTLSKVIFLLFNWTQFWELSGADLGGLFFHGFKLDLSMSGYLTMAIMLSWFIATFVNNRLYQQRLVNIVCYFLMAGASIITIVDARLYHYWGFKLDLTAFQFLSTPREALASFAWLDLLTGTFGLAFLLIVAILGYRCMFRATVFLQKKWHQLMYPILAMSILILPIRGGTDVATVGLSSAYFSNHNFANHAALNTSWNLMYAYLNRNKSATDLVSMDAREQYAIMQGLYPQHERLDAPVELKASTNVVFIVLESFSASLLHSLGGQKGVTPNLDTLAETGWYFTNFYASGDRSDKGLSSLFTGYPALPESSILRFPDKLARIPNIYRSLHLKGYKTSFLYGGNLDFANMKSLFSTVQDCEVISKNELASFAFKDVGKWGVHDAHTFEYWTGYLNNVKEPFFSTLYTLSSHEPFDIPTTSRRYTGPDAKCFEAASYTDSCLGIFIDKLKSSDLWSRTLIVITADHAIRQPGNVEVYHPDKFRIPLILTGGVINNHQVFSQFGSHTDLPYTLEWWLTGTRDSNMIFSRSLFNTKHSFANFFYQVGSGMIDSSGCVVFDFNAKKVLYSTVKNEGEGAILLKTKAYTKSVSEAYVKKP